MPPTRSGETALTLAAHKGHASFARWLLARGASRECRPHGWDLDDWIKQTSGLPPDKIAAILTLLGYREHLH
jgi:ankyrin repeat protein